MGAGKVLVDANHTVVLTSCAFVSGDQFAGSVPIVRPVRRRQHTEKRLYQTIHRNGDTSAGGGVGASGRITRGWQQSLMGECIWYRGNCRGRLYLTESLIVGKEESSITLQRPSDSSTELIADKLGDRIGAQIEVVLSVERRTPIQFPQRSVKLVTSSLVCHRDYGATVPAVLRVERVGQNADLLQLIQTEEKSGSARGGIAPDRIGRIHTVDQEVCHTRTSAVDRHLRVLTVRKQ